MKLKLEIQEPTSEDVRLKWVYNFDFLTHVKNICEKGNDYHVDQEQIAEILDALFEIAAQQVFP